MVILEAMGVPVIASAIEGIPEVIEDYVNDFLVTPEDVEELSENILQALKDPAMLESIARSAKEKVLTDMGGSAQARKVEKIYREVLAC